MDFGFGAYVALLGVLTNSKRMNAIELFARELDLTILSELPDGSPRDLVLEYREDSCWLRFLDLSLGRPFRVSFDLPKFREWRDSGLPRSHPFRRAVGEPNGEWALDATLGWGADTVTLLSLGYRVVAYDRHPVVVKMVCEAIERASRVDQKWGELFKNLEVHCGDVTRVAFQDNPKVVIIDPMFAKPKSSSLSPKPMQILQSLLEGGNSERDSGEGILKKLQLQNGRAVVKLPLKSPKSRLPSFRKSFAGQSIRLDLHSF